MITKIMAAERVTNKGISMILANGEHPEILEKILVDGEEIGTLFLGKRGEA